MSNGLTRFVGRRKMNRIMTPTYSRERVDVGVSKNEIVRRYSRRTDCTTIDPSMLRTAWGATDRRFSSSKMISVMLIVAPGVAPLQKEVKVGVEESRRIGWVKA